VYIKGLFVTKNANNRSFLMNICVFARKTKLWKDVTSIGLCNFNVNGNYIKKIN